MAGRSSIRLVDYMGIRWNLLRKSLVRRRISLWDCLREYIRRCRKLLLEAQSILLPICKRVITEIFPYVIYNKLKKKMSRLEGNDEILKKPEYSRFIELDTDKLCKRLDDEDQRASAINEKTYKMALTLSVAMTIIGYSLTEVSDKIQHPVVEFIFFGLIVIGIFYSLVSAVIALGALRTEPYYGNTTQLLLEPNVERQRLLADCLARTEVRNLRRQHRNEATYMGLRNGNVLFLTALVLFVLSLSVSFFSGSGTENPEEVGYSLVGGIEQ